MKIKLLRHAVVCGAVLWWTGGCGEKSPLLVPVTGVITLEEKPVGEVIVNFSPIGATEGSGALGATDLEGQFELTDVRGQEGAHPGEYKVHLYPAPLAPAGDVPTDVVSVGGAGVPSIYIDPNQTPVVVQVPPQGAHVEIDLTRDGRNVQSTITARAE